MTDKSSPIGIFDSGLGGLTSLKAVKSLLPHEDIIYFGDTARVPYGDRSKETIIEYVKDDINFLLTHGVKAIVIACNTADSMAKAEMNEIYKLPILGVVSPASEVAAKATKNNKIGVIGTKATVKSGSYEKLLKEYNTQAEVFSQACPLLVPLVEDGRVGIDDTVTREVLSGYLEPLKEKGIDTLVLGCTHYPLLSDIIHDIMPDVTLVSSGAAAANVLKETLISQNLLNDKKEKGNTSFFVSDNVSDFCENGGMFIGEKITDSVKLYSF